VHVRNMSIPSVDRLIASLEEARKARCGNLTLQNLAEDGAPRAALTLAARRD
jgi:hypothetical protein